VNLRYQGTAFVILDERLEQMVLTHEKYVNPEIILQDDNIAIQGCNEKYVWFAKNDPEVSTYVVFIKYLANICS